jgi:hypothetical protein
MVSLFAKRTMRKDMLLGQEEIICDARRGSSISSNPYSCILLSVLHVELEIIFRGADGASRNSTKPDTLLTIVVSTKASPALTTAVNTSNPVTTGLDDLLAEGGVVRPTIKFNYDARQPTAVAASLSPLFQAHGVPVPTEGDTPVRPAVGSQAEISRTLGRAEEATEAMGTINAWKTAIAVIKQVMDTVDPIADV